MKSVQGHFGWKITFQDFLNCTCLFCTSFCRVNSNYLKPIWNLMQKTRFNQNASLMEKGIFFRSLAGKRRKFLAWVFFSNDTLSIRLNVDNLISQTLFSFFLCAQLNLLSNLSCVSCDQFPDWIDPGPIFHHCEQLTVSKTRQTYCSSYQSTDLPSFNKISFQFQPFPISTRTPREMCKLLVVNFKMFVNFSGCFIVFDIAHILYINSKFWRRKVFLWIWWEFSSVTSWIDWTNLILYWNSKNFQVLEWNSMLNAKWCDIFSLFFVSIIRVAFIEKETYPSF